MATVQTRRRNPTRSIRVLRGLATTMFRTHRPAATPGLPLTTPSANGTHHERPEPMLRWTDARRAPGGDFAAIAIPNAVVDGDDIPDLSASWDAVSDFCLSYDGYAYWDDLPELANRCVQRWTRDRTLPEKLDELRGCLFYEQRRWHHLGTEPAGRSAAYVRAIVDAVRTLVPPAFAPGRIADPRVAIAPEAHVKLVAAPDEASPADVGAAASAAGLRPVPTHSAPLHPVPERITRLRPVAAAEAHVKLVRSIEAHARPAPVVMNGGRVSAMPTGWAKTEGATAGTSHTRHPSAHRTAHPSMSVSIADLKPMPTAEPLPKPPVIVRRPHPPESASPNRRGGAVITTLRPTGSRVSRDRRPRLEDLSAPAGSSASGTAFHRDDAGYLAWVGTHPDGYVLNLVRPASSGSPVLHRVGCAALRRAPGATKKLTTSVTKICGAIRAELEAWSVARGTGLPVLCRRCH